MSREIEFEVDKRDLDNLYKGLSKYPNVAKKAVMTALNRTVQSTNTELQRNITKTYNIKKKDLNGGSDYKGESSNNLVKAHKASEGNLSAYVEARGSSLTLYRFLKGDKQPHTKKGYRHKVAVYKSRTLVLSKYNFVQRAKGGLQLFEREENSRRIKGVMRTTSVAQMAANENVLMPTQKKTQEELKKRAAHELEYRLMKIKG